MNRRTDVCKGNRYGKLVLLKREVRQPHQLTWWLCKCDCGTKKWIRQSSFTRRSTTSCGCVRKGECYKTGICCSFWYAIKYGAKKRNIDFDITPKEVWSLFLKQNKKCAISGLELFIPSEDKDFVKLRPTASLDRIDSSKGYVKGNIQWLHKDVNRMKSTLDEDRFIELCKVIAKNNQSDVDN